MPARSIANLTPRYALARVGASIAIGVLAWAATDVFLSHAVALLVGWDVGGLTLLTMAWAIVWSSSPRETHSHAAAQDPGSKFVYAFVLLTSTVSLFSAVALTRTLEIVGTGERSIVLVLCLLTVAVSWAMTHTAFAFRYAHLYYRDDDEGVGGLKFPGGDEICYFDFAYFAFVIGMCFQVADTEITSLQIRKTVLMHALMSFAYNTAVVAFALNLAFGTFG
ncbi:MAG: DUF1345 domain-containing protein [Polyangiaceae bacterium]|nr:DUF1345 domain-containing protein [Polyangiaceae bacterium]